MFCQIAGQDAPRIRMECPPVRASGLRALTPWPQQQGRAVCDFGVFFCLSGGEPTGSVSRGSRVMSRGEGTIRKRGTSMVLLAERTMPTALPTSATPPASVRRHPTSRLRGSHLQRRGSTMASSIPGPQVGPLVTRAEDSAQSLSPGHL